MLLEHKPDLEAMYRPAGRWLAESTAGGVTYGVFHEQRSLWIRARWPEGAAVAFCAAYAFDSPTRLVDVEQQQPNEWRIRLHTVAGEYTVQVELPAANQPVLHWNTTLRPSTLLRVQAWPRDIVPIGACGDTSDTRGVVHAAQRGITGNVLFTSMTEPAHLSRGSLLYVQNLGALTSYFEHTKCSALERVGGTWPELGFELPPTAERPLQPEHEYVLSDAFVCVSDQIPRDDVQAARLFLDLYTCAYLKLPKPQQTHRHWQRRVAETARDLSHSPECGQDIEGNRYALAYAGSADIPPESTVQLAVLVPMQEWAKKHGVDVPLCRALRRNLPTFFDDKLKTMVRWLPARHDLLQGQEEHMRPNVMDAWYLLHTCMNMARLASAGDREAKELFFRSIDYGIRVAQRFDYQWPVFYDLKTLDVIKAETAPGKGGEHDVGGLYAHVMLAAFDLSGDQRFVEEAKRAASRLHGFGFDLAYQYNNVSFGAGALYRLWKITGDEQYRGLSDICWANVVRNLWLWDCNYGYANHYGTFMGLAPLQDAKYLALYEELEVLAAIHEYLAMADDASKPLRVLLPEYCKYLIDRAWFHYPSELPRDLLAEKAKTGNLHRYLSVPVEDLGEGWERAGGVGQEVYGGSAPFIIATRHCHRVPGEDFTLYCSYPVADMKVHRDEHEGSARFRFMGDARCEASLRIVPNDFSALPKFKASRRTGKLKKSIDGSLSPLGYYEYVIPGDSKLEVTWGKKNLFIGSSPVPNESPTRPKGLRHRTQPRKKAKKR
jgi:hypothetical protein